MIYLSLFPLQPALDTILSGMWWHGEDGQVARTLQKLPETSVRPVAQEQVGVCHFFSSLDHSSLTLKEHLSLPTSCSLFHNSVV